MQRVVEKNTNADSGDGASRSTGRGTGGPRPGTGGARGPGAYPEAVERLVTEFARLPGIGKRTAERLAFHILKASASEALPLATAINDVKRSVRHCKICYHLADGDECGICADARRDRTCVMVVERPRDLIAVEQTGMYRGIYHVLMGRVSPLDGVQPEDLTISDLVERVRLPERNTGGEPIQEVIFAMNPTLEGDGTALYITEALRTAGVRLSRLARGLPAGSQIEYANKSVLTDALQSRQGMP